MHKINVKRTVICLLRKRFKRNQNRLVKDDDDVIWVTINGRHIPIRTKKDIKKIGEAFKKKHSYERKEHDIIHLEKDEYAKVMHEINTNLPDEQRSWTICSKDIGEYTYTFRNLGFGNYEIIRKIKIR